jgi:NADH-quinone oxidoreductase subunit C
MPDEQKPEGASPPPDKPAEGDKPAPAKPAAPPAAKPAAPAAHAAPKPPAPMATTPWESDLTRNLAEHFGDRIPEFSTYLGQNFLVAKPESIAPILEFLKLEEDFDYLVDLTAVDYPKREARFDLIYIVYSFAKNERIRVKSIVAEGARPATATTVHSAANWLEREVFDMFGIVFDGHPNLRRMLLPDDWDEGFPLRKDYPLRGWKEFPVYNTERTVGRSRTRWTGRGV